MPDPNRYLILDDDQHRIDSYTANLKACLPHCEIVVTNHAADCIAELSKPGIFDRVFLDRSLNGRAFVPDDDPDSGDAVVQFLCDNHEIRRQHLKYIVHSLDEEKAKRMVRNLLQFRDVRAEYRPGGA